MIQPPATPSQRLDTAAVPPSHRFDFWADRLSNSLTPMRIEQAAPRKGFAAALSVSALGRLNVVTSTGDGHVAVRGRAEIGRSEGRSLHLIVSTSTVWEIDHLGTHRLNPGDLILTDTRYPHRVSLPSGHGLLNVKIPPDWLETWLPDVDQHTGRRLDGRTGMAKALRLFAQRLTPDVVDGLQTAPSAVADQLGGLMALASPPRQAPDRRMHLRLKAIQRHMRLRCCDQTLTAATVADELGLAPAMLHRALTADRSTFALALRRMRVDLACQLMTGPGMAARTDGEIALKAGFSSSREMEAALGAL